MLDSFEPQLVAERIVGCTELDELAVRPNHRRQGIGRLLLDTLAPTDGPPAWLITARKADGAVALYRAAGWEELTGTIPDGDEVLVFATPR